MAARTYPGHADYEFAVIHLNDFVFDPVLKGGIPRTGNRGEPLSYPGGFATAYVIECGNKLYALRVWLKDIGNAARHYGLVSPVLKQQGLPYFVDAEFIANGILVNGQRYPILRMEWIEAFGCREFIRANLNDGMTLRAASESFLQLVRNLHARKFAHGDLQADNMLLRQSSRSVGYKLIDYDTFVIPSLIGQPIVSIGHPAYQHPRRSLSNKATEKDDYFAELVIYLCLCAVAEDPTIWKDFPEDGRDKELLFNGDDFAAVAPTPVFRRLYAFGGLVQKLAVVLWNFTRCPGIHLLQPLERMVELAVNKPLGAEGSAARSRFDDFIVQKMSKAAPMTDQPRGWLDDSAFRGGFQFGTEVAGPVPSLQPLPAGLWEIPKSPMELTGGAVSDGNFQELLRRLSESTSITPQPGPQPQPGPPPQPQPWPHWDVVSAIVMIILILILAAYCQSS